MIDYSITTILYYTLLYYDILYYIILYYTILYYTTLHYTFAAAPSVLTPFVRREVNASTTFEDAEALLNKETSVYYFITFDMTHRY